MFDHKGFAEVVLVREIESAQHLIVTLNTVEAGARTPSFCKTCRKIAQESKPSFDGLQPARQRKASAS
jgi:hypothetical protein